MKMGDEVIAVLAGEKQIVELDLGQPRNRAEHQILDAGLCGRGHRDGVTVTAQAGAEPQNVQLRDGLVWSRMDHKGTDGYSIDSAVSLSRADPNHILFQFGSVCIRVHPRPLRWVAPTGQDPTTMTRNLTTDGH